MRRERSQLCFRNENVKVNERGQNRTIANRKPEREPKAKSKRKVERRDAHLSGSVPEGRILRPSTQS